MRIFQRFPEAFAEIKRDLAEMGKHIHTRTMQDKVIADDPDYATLALNDYDYRVIEPRLEDLSPTQPWADAEWEERLLGINGRPVNPGTAWQLRAEVWKEFLHDNGFFYTYSEQFSRHSQVRHIIDALKRDIHSRQGVISIWEPRFSHYLGRARVPCSITYEVEFWDDRLNLTYRMRSCDFVTHYHNDCYLAMKLQRHIASELGVEPGYFCHLIRNLHVYQKDVKGVF